VSEDGKLRMRILPSTSQSNATDCGVYAAAYVAEIINGNMKGIQALFDVGAMRAHLMQCLELQSLHPFPKASGRQIGRRRKIIIVDVSENGCDVVM